MEFVEAEEDQQSVTDEQLSREIERFRNVVLSACSALGDTMPVAVSIPSQQTSLSTDGGAEVAQATLVSKMEYVPKSECLPSLKDIKRYIQEDELGEGKMVLQWLGDCRVLQTDIIPLFIHFTRQIQSPQPGHDRDRALKIIMMCVELFVFLTWSMDSEPKEVKVRFIYVLRSYKQAFANPDAVSSLLSIAVTYFRKPIKTDKEALLVKGILYVFRNILAIPDPLISPTSTGLSQVEVHDTLIAVLDKELAIDFFLALASSADDKQLKDLRPTLLDIVYYLFYRVPVSALFDQQQTWFKADDDRRTGRHNNFGGVYAVSTGDSTIMPVFSAKEVLHPFANLFKRRKPVQKPKEKDDSNPVDHEWRILSPSSIPVLRRIAAVFIDSCFNPFVSAAFEDVRASGTVMDASTTRLLYVAGYFVDISLANPAVDIGCTSALVQTHIFGLVMRNASAYVEMKEWVALEPAMYCIQQILLSLARMRGTKLNSLSDNVLSNLFYDGDALDLFVRLCRVFKPTKHTRRFLEQTARLTETFLTTLKSYAQAKTNLVVKRRVKKRAPKRAPKSAHNDKDAPPGTDIASGGKDCDANLAVDADGPNGTRTKDTEPAGLDNSRSATDESEIDKGAEDSAEDAENEESDDENASEVLVEREFDIAKYERAFATSDVVVSYSHLLAPPSSIEFVYPMLNRIAITYEKPHLFFKKKILNKMLYLFDDQFSYPHRTEMLDLVAWIFRQYMTAISSPALRNHYKAEELNDQLAIECMLAFLKQSRLGTREKPVITRHIVELLAGNGDGRDEGNADRSDSDDADKVSKTTAADGDSGFDFDFDFDFQGPQPAADNAASNSNQGMDDSDIDEQYFSS